MEKSNSAQAVCFPCWSSTPAFLESVVTSVSTSGQPLDANWILQDFCLDQDASLIPVYPQAHFPIPSVSRFLCSLKYISWQLLTSIYTATWRFASEKRNLGSNPRLEWWLLFSVCVKVILAITQETHNALHAYACLGEYWTYIRIKMLIKKGVVCIKFLKGFMRRCNKLSKEYGFGCERRKT